MLITILIMMNVQSQVKVQYASTVEMAFAMHQEARIDATVPVIVVEILGIRLLAKP